VESCRYMEKQARDIGSRQIPDWAAHNTLGTAEATYQSTIHNPESSPLGVAAWNAAVV